MKTGQLGEARSWPRPKRPICRATAPTPPDRTARRRYPCRKAPPYTEIT